MSTPSNIRFKILMLGEGTVGKTTFKNQFLTGKFTDKYTATMGADFASHTMTYNGDTVIMSIWDMAGQKNQSLIRKSFYKGANGALLLFDVTNIDTFTSLEPIWLKELQQTLSTKIPFLLIANKIDLIDTRSVSSEESKSFLEKIQTKGWMAESVETSALLGTNVKESFTRLVELMLQNYQNQQNK